MDSLGLRAVNTTLELVHLVSVDWPPTTSTRATLFEPPAYQALVGWAVLSPELVKRPGISSWSAA